MSESPSFAGSDPTSLASGLDSAGLLRLPRAAAGSPWRWVIPVIMLATVVVGFFDRISIAVLFTDSGFNAALGTAFRPEMLGMLMTAFLLAYAVSALLLSFVGDLLGPRRALGYAAGIWGVLMALMGGISSYAAMLVLRIVLGVTEGPQYSLISKAVHRWFPPHERTRANSIWMIGSPLGSAIGFPLTIWLVASFGWRASFYVLGLLSFAIVMPLIFAVVRDQPPTPVEGASPAVAEPEPFRLADVRTLLSDYRVWLLCLFGGGLLTYVWGLNSWLPTYLERERHFNLRQMGFYSSLPFVLMLITQACSGYVSDRTDRAARNCVSGLFIACVLLFLGTQAHDPRLAAIIIACSAGALGFAMPTHYALAMKVLPASATSTGIGVINGVGNLIGACAPALIGWVVAATGSFQTGLLVVVIASMLGALALLPLIRKY